MTAILSSYTNQQFQPSSFHGNYPDQFWNNIQGMKDQCRSSNTLNEFLRYLVSGIGKLYKQSDVTWFQSHCFEMIPHYEPSDITTLHISSENEISSEIEVCLVLNQIRTIWAHSFNGLELQYGWSKYDHVSGYVECMRIGDPHFGMDHWILVKLQDDQRHLGDRTFLESLMESVAKLYRERAHLFDFNRRVSFQFDQLFDASKNPFYLSLNFEWRTTKEAEASFRYEYGLVADEVLGVVSEKLKTWNQSENLYSYGKTKVTSYSMRFGNCDFIVLVKFDAILECWKVVLNLDSIQKRRMERARELFTKRQFEAFVHFEDGANCSKTLSRKMGISPRTAERYRGIILHYLDNDLNPVRGAY